MITITAYVLSFLAILSHTKSFLNVDQIPLSYTLSEVSNAPSAWWLLLLLIIPLGLFIFRNSPFVILLFMKRKRRNSDNNVVTSALNQDLINDFFIENIESRQFFHPSEIVNKGKFLEITKDHKATNRILENIEGALPSTLEESNAYILLTEQEVHQINEIKIKSNQYYDRSPSAPYTPGVFMKPHQQSRRFVQSRQRNYSVNVSNKIANIQKNYMRKIK